MVEHPKTPTQLNASAFASCLSQAGPGVLPNLPLMKHTYNFPYASEEINPGGFLQGGNSGALNPALGDRRRADINFTLPRRDGV